ncbi:hypothetical protein CC86DRAFT_405898 [Ophiobolus disseminans]|uniref:CBM1 domain-containing protein n=1 Tax=Ophiobolus disseminans TaxID=1469910 RepID=A0A6A7A0J8_9PLEO|nr:hypothetical protein CC86DRAFT_405898 [Ophiobolus disseminans]
MRIPLLTALLTLLALPLANANKDPEKPHCWDWGRGSWCQNNAITYCANSKLFSLPCNVRFQCVEHPVTVARCVPM